MKNIILSRNQFDRLIKESVREEVYNVFHGSPYGNIVSGKFRKGRNGVFGGGIYFAESKGRAKHYAKKMGEGTIYTVNLDIKNPLVINGVNGTAEFLHKIYGSNRIYDKRKLKQGNDCYIITPKDIKKMLSLGYDGVIWDYTDEKEYVVYDSSQITILDKEDVSYRAQIREDIDNGGKSVWYRGYNSQYDNWGSEKGLWITDDYEYAKEYADNYEGQGKVVAFEIDESRIKPCSLYDIDEYLGEEFDPYEPEGYWENGLFDTLLKEGYNCYEMWYNNQDVRGLYLFDNSPIIRSYDVNN